MRLSVAAAGNAEKNINIINARFQAEALRQLRGYDTGVLVNSFFSPTDPTGEKRDQNNDFMWKLTASTVSDIAVGRGMATAYGFDIQSEETVHFTATAPSAGSKYLFIYLEWDFSNSEEAVGKIDIRDNGSSSSWTPSRRDNLITNPIGAYQLILYRLQVSTAGRITAITKWGELGVASIECPVFATYSRDATNAKYAEYAKGKTEKTLERHLSDIYARLDALGFKEGVASISSGTVQRNSLKKQGLFVIFDFYFFIERDVDLVITIPPEFRPNAAKTIHAEQWVGTTTFDLTLTLNTDGTIKVPSKDDQGRVRYSVSAWDAFWQIADF